MLIWLLFKKAADSEGQHLQAQTEPADQHLREQFIECALAAGIMVTWQGRLVDSKSINLTYEYANIHNQILIAGPNHVSTNVSPVSKQCNVKGVVAIILKCSKDQCVQMLNETKL